MRRGLIVASCVALLAAGSFAQDAILEPARARLLAGDPEGARALLRAEVDRRPEAATGETWRLLGLAAEAAGHEDEAGLAFERALAGGAGGVDVVARLARRAAAEERWGRAADLLRLWMAATPDDPALARALGPALERAGRHEEAARFHLTRFAAGIEARDAALGAARCARALGRVEEELVWWTLAARLGADSPRERAFRAELLARFGRRGEAAALRAEDVPDVAPDGLVALRARAVAAAGSPEEAPAWGDYFAAGGDETSAHRRYGRLLVRAGRGEEALPHLAAAAAAGGVEDLALLVRLEGELGEREAAERALRRLVAAEGLSPRVRDLRRRLRAR